MTDKHSDKEGLMQFVEESSEGSMQAERRVWKILIIDDEKDVHSATTFALRSTEVVGRPLEFILASSSREAKEILRTQKDIAVIILDVVMETPNAGLDLVPVIRDELGIADTRIILRTGQPNQAPEIEVIRDYDINDYKLKSELTQARLFASLTTAIRSYKQIRTIEAGKKSLGMIVKSSAELLTQHGIKDFAQGVILHLSGLLSISPEGLICARRRDRSAQETKIIAAAGHFKPFINRPLSELSERDAQNSLSECLNTQKNIFKKHGIALYIGSHERGDMACFVSSEAEFSEIDENLLELFCRNITICADNLDLVAQLSEYAYYDLLTSLPNRNSLVEKINKAIDNRAGDYLLCMVDIDNFAEINSSLGQAYGDAILKTAGSCLQEEFAKPCFVSRAAGDTFAVFGPEHLIDQDRLLDIFDTPFEVDGEAQSLSVTAAVVPVSKASGSGDEVIKDATIVLEAVKNPIHRGVPLYRRSMVRDAQDSLAVLQHLRSTFELNQLYLVFQPKLRFSDMAVTGFESLVRWRDQNGKPVSPEMFIPLAEQSGLIAKVGAWFFRESVKSLQEFHRQGWSDCDMSVNLSLAQLQHSEIVDLLSSTLSELGIDPKRINLEITESFAVSDLESTLKLLKKIKEMGFSISLQDYTAGYTLLNHLHQIPIDHLKIDRSIIKSVCSEGSREVLVMMVHLAEKLGLAVIADGVEGRSEIDFLNSLDCDQLHGFYYCKPMEQSLLLEWLESKEIH